MSCTLRLVVVAVAMGAAAVACAPPPAEREAAAPALTPPPAPPVAIHVAMPEGASAAATEWAHALEAAIAARAGDLQLAPDPASAELEVRIHSVEPAPAGTEAPGEGDPFVMRGALVAGEITREFNLAYRGAPGPQAEALARNLRGFGEKMKTPSPPADPSPSPAG